MKNIVKVENNELMVSIADIAKFSKNDIESVKRLLRSKRADFQSLGLTDLKSVFSETKLNEPQATLLIISLRSSEVVDKFRLNLVKQFYRMRETICETNKKQLLQKDSTIQKLKEKRKVYASPRAGSAQSVKRIIMDYNIQITPEVLNQLLYENNLVKRRLVEVFKYSSDNMNQGTALVNTDEVLKIVDDNGYARNISYSDSHPQLNFEE